MDKTQDDAIQTGTSPRWQMWAIVGVILGCLATLAATIYDIA